MLWSSASIGFRCVLVSNAVFWPASLLGLYADYLVAARKLPLLSRCKLQNRTHISGRDRRDLILLTSFNMLVVSLFLCAPLYEWMWGRMQGVHRLTDSDEWMWQREMLLKIPLHLAVTETSFYLVHRLLHSSSFLYRYVHEVHHRFPAPTVMACVYAHPLEFAFGNVLPIYLGPMLSNAHPNTSYLWFAAAILGTCKGHCGYRILGHEDYHEHHHVFYRYNYGSLYLLDSLLGTMLDKRRRAEKDVAS